MRKQMAQRRQNMIREIAQAVLVISEACPSFFALLLAICAAMFVSLPSCHDGSDTTPRYLRGLSDSTIQYLTTGNDSAFARYMRPSGSLGVENTLRQFFANVAVLEPEDYVRHRVELLRCWKRLGEHAFRTYGSPVWLDEYNKRKDLRAEQIIGLYRAASNLSALERDARLSTRERLAALGEFSALFERHDYCYGRGRCLLDMAKCYADLGDLKDQRDSYHRALRVFGECGELVLRCQCLGELGNLCEQAGEIDSMRRYYDEALRIARERRLSDQAPRIVSFYASHYAGVGRLGLAHDLYGEAIRISREYGGEHRELRFIRESMKFHANIECWSVVEDLDERARLLEHLYAGRFRDPINTQLLRLQEGRLRMFEGKVAEAEDIFRRIEKPLERAPQRRGVYPELLYYWGEGLLENGQPRRAVARLGKGLRFAVEKHNWSGAARLAVLLAETHLEMGDPAAAERCLAEYDRCRAEVKEDTRFATIRRDILSVRLALAGAGGDPSNSAVLKLSHALARFIRYLASTDPSPQSYLWIAKSDSYRGLMHRVAADAELGYGVELFWRDFYRFLGANARRKSGAGRPENDVDELARELDAGRLLEVIRARAQAARSRIGALKAVHCLYRCDDSGVVRWTVTAGGIRRDSLASPADTLRQLASETNALLSTRRAGTASVPEATLATRLRRLGRLLLPPEAFGATEPASGALILVTADGLLESIPFEAFDVGDSTRYSPLIMQRDVAYLRFADAPGVGTSPGPGVILVNESAPVDLHGAAAQGPRLEQATKEAAALAALDPAAVLLAGEHATKAELLHRLATASYLYVAAHTIREPEAPYLMLIPLAPGREGEAPEFSNLDFLDIRSINLSQCEVVVLSGCSTGAPYFEHRANGPAFGDAFLDAGAAAVVETFWDVRDEDALALMSSFTRLWMGQKRSAIAAVCAARRSTIASQGGAVPASSETGALRHPSAWAAYSIKIGRL